MQRTPPRLALYAASCAALLLSSQGCGDTDPGAADGDASGAEVDASDPSDGAQPTDLDDSLESDLAQPDGVLDAVDTPDTPDIDGAHPDLPPPDTGDTGDTGDGDLDGPAPRCGDGTPDPGEDCDDGNTDDLDGCTRACELGPVVRAPAVGEVVIAELMIDPGRVPDLRGEWIELVSLAAEPVNLSACALVDDGTDRVALDLVGGLTLAPGEILVLGLDPDPATNGGVLVDVPYATMLLEDLADEVALVCPSADGLTPAMGDARHIDRVAWTPFAWPVVQGRSLSLDPSRMSHLDNDRVDSWCSGQLRYGLGDRGSPKTINPSCPHLDREVDACRLLAPPVIDAFRDAPVTVGLEVEELGLTDLTAGVDQSPQLVIEVGFGPLPPPGPLDALAFSGFAFARAVPEPDYLAPVGSHADRWRAELVSTALGGFGVVARASRDGGATWRYCDRDGSDNGLMADQLARLEVTETPCLATSCLTPPPAACAPDGVGVIAYASPGRCTPLSSETFECAYSLGRVDCGALGRACELVTEPTPSAGCGPIPRPPLPGELVFTELMIGPTASLDVPTGQWVELTNRAQEPLLLTGCTLTHTPLPQAPDEERALVIESPLVIGVGAQLVLGATLDPAVNGDTPVDFAWGDAFALTSASSLSLACGDLIDAVAWGPTWPLSPGAALQLSPFRTDAAANAEVSSWCRATSAYGAGDRGTPGAPNPNCPGDIVPVEGCRVVASNLVTPPAGTESSVPLAVLVRALTGRTVRTDPAAGLWLEVGLAARGAPASTITTWRRAAVDTAWTTVGQNVDPAEDRYHGRFKVPPVGAWDLYARATADGGNTWALCDLDGIVPGGASPRPLAVEPVASACDPDPCVTPPLPICQPVTSGSPTVVLGRAGPATCALDAGQPGGVSCAFVDTPLEDCALRGAVCSEGALDTAGDPDEAGARCVGFPRRPEPGEAVISELMIAPLVSGIANELGEWIEVTNVGDDALDLAGCALQSGAPDGGVERWAIPASSQLLAYAIQPGQALTFARSATSSINGQSQPAAVWSSLALDNAADWVELVCGDGLDELVVSRVVWDAADGWPIVSGRSLQLSGAFLDDEASRIPSYWCSPGPATPRLVNRVCPGDGVIDGCRLVAGGLEASAEDTVRYEVLVYDPGVTDLRPVTDAASLVHVEVGVGAFGLNPRSSLRWTWYAGEPDPGWDEREAGNAEWAGWDRWRASFVPLRPADLHLEAGSSEPVELAVMARVSHDGGKTFRVCGLTGFSDSAEDGDELSLTPGVCAPNPCLSPPAATCSGATLVARTVPGTCNIVGGEASCAYGTRTFTCSAYGGCNASLGSCNTAPPKPTAPGALVITEVLRESTLALPDRGEWFEVLNPGATGLDVRGCQVVVGSGSAEQRMTLDGPVPELIQAGAFGLFVQSAVSSENGGIPTWYGPLRVFGVELPNSIGSLAIECGGTVIDRVSWSLGWPGQRGVAMQVDRNRVSHVLNDNVANWCAAPFSYGNLFHLGSPGTTNAICF